MVAVCVPSSLKQGCLFCIWSFMKRHPCAVGNEYTVRKWRSDITSFTYSEISIQTHTEQLKIKWHLSAYISSYRPQHHSQVSGSMAYDMFIIKGKYREWCDTKVLHCIPVNNSQRMLIHPKEIVGLAMEIHMPDYPFHHTWLLLVWIQRS